MRVLVIGGTGFTGAHIVRQLARCEHTVAVYHRGRRSTALPEQVIQFLDPLSVMPIEKFPAQLFDFEPDVVVHTVAMGATDSTVFARAFSGRTGRLILLSSGDVYRAYGRFAGLEPGPIEQGLLFEGAPLRTVLFPYRKQASLPNSLEYWYEKILAEQAVLKNPGLPATVLRLPKVYGPGGQRGPGNCISLPRSAELALDSWLCRKRCCCDRACSDTSFGRGRYLQRRGGVHSYDGRTVGVDASIAH